MTENDEECNDEECSRSGGDGHDEGRGLVGGGGRGGTWTTMLVTRHWEVGT